MNDIAPPILEENLSRAWGRALLMSVSPKLRELVPLSVTVTGFKEGDPAEDRNIRHALEECLATNRCQSCHTVANTIFPQSLWNRSADRKALYDRYKAIIPSIKAMHSANRYGLYFERLISYGADEDAEKCNQLEHIITTWHSGNHRRSALQAAIFDPDKDHTDQRQRGFPCLQHVIFTPTGATGLAVTGFYAMQYLFDRAYGNYLGLCRLGRFMAQELGLELVRMTCFAAIATHGKTKKEVLRPLIETLQEILPDPDASHSQP